MKTQNTAKHTPGPWTLDHSKHFGNTQVLGAMFSNGSMAIAVCSGPEEQANARLIAAAPKLLEALKRFVEAEGREGFIAKLQERNPDTLDDAQAWYVEAFESALSAIAKAEGAQ